MKKVISIIVICKNFKIKFKKLISNHFFKTNKNNLLMAIIEVRALLMI
jgi:hypothetical protein